MSFSSASSASSLGKIAVDLASQALEEFLESEEVQKTIVKTISSSVASSSQSVSAASKAKNDLNSFLGDNDEEI